MSYASVLVIDDEPQIRRVVRHAVEAEVERVIEASTGREGIDAAAAEQPALIVLDLGLPDIEGLETSRLKQLDFSLSLKALEAGAATARRPASLICGASD